MELIDRDERPQCAGVVLEHVDGTEGACSLGARCPGGAHAKATDCTPDQCPHCATLACLHDVIEHRNGAEECRGLGDQCPADSWHEGDLVPCEDVYGDEHTCPPERQT